MGTGSSSRDRPVGAARVEVIHRCELTRVVRLSRPDGTVVRKELLGPDAEHRLRHEVAVLERLAGVAGVAQLAGAQRYPGSITLADAGPTCLADFPAPLPPDALIRLSLGLARAVAGMHERGVLHRDICPANIVLSGQAQTGCLVDFALASTFAELRPEFLPHSQIAGTLAYLAPEQTGRTGRPVDQRADLYALGATLYELATGAPPFGTGDPLQVSHDHLARVPVPAVQRNHAVPEALSEVIARLLEKEPDNRYQTAEGVVHDLLRIQAGAAHLRVGMHDFPARLLAPSRLAGRAPQLAALGAAFAGALSGHCHGVVVSGAPGVGKTSLINELRPIVTAADGWFVSGKFDQYRRDQQFDAVALAFRALGRLLLAEPDEELDDVRARLLGALGSNAGLLAAVIPEFATLLQIAPDQGDPATAQVRAQRTALAMLQVVVSRKRPVVLVLDDLQWAPATPLSVVDMVLSGEEEIEGLLMVAAFREGAVDEAHPLSAMLARWERQDVEHLRLRNLPAASVTAMVADMLRLDGGRVAALAEPVTRRTDGNPYDTVELLNALRHEDVLMPGPDGWRWDESALRRALDQADVTDLFTARVNAMPPGTRGVLQAMACLAGRVEVDLLRLATALPAEVVEQRLTPALNDGLLVLESGAREEVRFRHDRIQEAILAHMDPRGLRDLRLTLARQLARWPEAFAVAAEQYLPVVDAVDDPDERRRVVDLLRRAAQQAQILSNHMVTEARLAAAATLVDPADTDTLIAVHTGRHAALCSLGRLDEADEIYRTIDRLATTAQQRAGAVLAQIGSLTNRNHPHAALRLGIEQLQRFGHPVPQPDQLDSDIQRGLAHLYRWVDSGDEADDLSRPELTDPLLLDIAALVNRLTPAAFFCDNAMFCWLGLQAVQMWAEHGPGPTLVGPVSNIAFITTGLRQDYRTGYRAMRRILAVSRQRRYDPHVSQARFLYALGTSPWFEPLEENVALAQQAREALIQGGDLQNACHTYYVSIYQLLDCAPTLDSFVTEVESGLAMATRTGDDHSVTVYGSRRWLVNELRGEPAMSPADPSPPHRFAGNQMALANEHLSRALAAVVLDDARTVEVHLAAAERVLSVMTATYMTAIACLLRILVLAGRARAADADDRQPILDQLDTQTAWLAARAADAPVNFAHLLCLAQAERAWAADDFVAAASAYDGAMRQVALRQRPWHQALITERAARFYSAYHLEHLGNTLLATAARQYRAWGATAKVSQLHQRHPTLPWESGGGPEQALDSAPDASNHHSSITTGAIDLLGILAASQALSSETSLDGLRARVVEVLSAMTGATGVQLLLWNDSEQSWRVSTMDGGGSGISAELVPLSVIRYAERTREPLVVNDALRDDRFSRDPYLADCATCSLLAVPILNRGELSALLLLENRLIRAAFSAERLDGVILIAGQLAVSLDNALVYASLERKVTERTRQLAIANERLEQLSGTDPLTGLANRRRLEEVLNNQWRRGQRSGRPLGLAMIDVDHFKYYNDQYGHPRGDDCLQQIAAELIRTTGSADLVARYGGEEFAIVMPDTDIASATRLAERLRTGVNALAITHALASAGVVTISIGVAAVVPSSDSGVEELVQLADVELYRAKRAGRNRVETAVTSTSA